MTDLTQIPFDDLFKEMNRREKIQWEEQQKNLYTKTVKLEDLPTRSLPDELLDVLKRKAQEPYQYINPNFLGEITSAIWDYYKLEDDMVDQWVQDMFGA